MLCSAQNISSNCTSDLAAVFVLQNVSSEPVISSSASLDTEKAALQGASRLFRVYGHKSVETVSAGDETLYLRAVLECTVQLLLADPLYSVGQKIEAKHFTYGKLLASDVKAVAELVTILLRPSGHPVLFCSAQQMDVLHRMLLQSH